MAHDFWLGVCCIAGIGAVWLATVLFVLDVDIVPAWTNDDRPADADAREVA
jgi:hypothetical protein